MILPCLSSIGLYSLIQGIDRNVCWHALLPASMIVIASLPADSLGQPKAGEGDVPRQVILDGTSSDMRKVIER